MLTITSKGKHHYRKSKTAIIPNKTDIIRNNNKSFSVYKNNSVVTIRLSVNYNQHQHQHSRNYIYNNQKETVKQQSNQA